MVVYFWKINILVTYSRSLENTDLY